MKSFINAIKEAKKNRVIIHVKNSPAETTPYWFNEKEALKYFVNNEVGLYVDVKIHEDYKYAEFLAVSRFGCHIHKEMKFETPYETVTLEDIHNALYKAIKSEVRELLYDEQNEMNQTA